MKAVPWSRCCSNSTLMSFNTPWACRRGECVVWVCVFAFCVNLYMCVYTDVPESHRSRSAASCVWCCYRLFHQSQPVRGGGRSQWGRRPCWGLRQRSRIAGDTVCSLTPRHGQTHQFLLVETQSGQLEELAVLKEVKMGEWSVHPELVNSI